MHLADQAQPVDVRIQRAQPVRQLLGQHRHDAVGEIHRRAARARLAVERRVGAARSGSRRRSRRAAASRRRCGSQYTASSKSRASAPSIVTSGTPRKSSRPSFAFSGTSADQRARLGEHLFRPLVRNAVREDRDLRIDAGLVLAADDIETRPTAWLRLLGYSSTSTLTMSPGFAPCASPRAISTSVRDSPLSSTKSMPRSRRNCPTMRVLPRARISTTCPSRPRARLAGARGDAIAVPEQLHLAARRDRDRRCRHRAGGNRTRRDALARARSRGRDGPSGSTRRRGCGAVGRRAPSRACAASSARRCWSVWISKRGARASSVSGLPGAAPWPREISSRLGIWCS